MKLRCLAVVALLVLSGTAFGQEGPQLTTARLREPQQRALFQPLANNFKLRFADATGAFRVDNAAALTLQVDKGAQPFLSTLPYPGSAQFLTALKPCGIVAPHIHLRATEIYSVIYGTLNAGIAQENGAAQNITFTVAPGEAVAVPQGLLHAQSNNQCSSVAFFQTFNNADPGSLTMGNALAALGAVSPGLLGATNVQATSTGLGAFALDPQCLQRCNLPSSGGSLNDLPDNIKVMFGLTAAAPSSPMASPSPAATAQTPTTTATSPASAASSSMSSSRAQTPASGGSGGPCPCSLAPGFDATNLNLRQMLLTSGSCPPDVYPGCPSGSFGYGNSGGCGNVGCFNTGTNNIGNYNTGTSNQGEFNSGTGLIGRNQTGTGTFNVASVPGVAASGR